MRKRPKTITLDEQTALLAERMPNFSGWVRNKLRMHAVDLVKESAHVAPEEARKWGETKDKCNPNHRDGRCGVCWSGE